MLATSSVDHEIATVLQRLLLDPDPAIRALAGVELRRARTWKVPWRLTGEWSLDAFLDDGNAGEPILFSPILNL